MFDIITSIYFKIFFRLIRQDSLLSSRQRLLPPRPYYLIFPCVSLKTSTNLQTIKLTPLPKYSYMHKFSTSLTCKICTYQIT